MSLNILSSNKTHTDECLEIQETETWSDEDHIQDDYEDITMKENTMGHETNISVWELLRMGWKRT